VKELLVLGAGTAGMMTVNKLRRRPAVSQWNITVVDADAVHHYQPGYLFVPFGTYTPEQISRSRDTTLANGVSLVIGEVDSVDAAANLERHEQRHR
jgi:sulfide:quinone oxidoreductase